MLVVKAIFMTIPVDKLCSTPDIPEIMTGITPYAERHFERIDRLYMSTYLLDYTLANMGELDPSDDVESERLFDEWAASSKPVLPPKTVDGRIQVGGKTIVGAAPSKIMIESDDEEDDDEIRTIGDSTSNSDSDNESVHESKTESADVEMDDNSENS